MCVCACLGVCVSSSTRDVVMAIKMSGSCSRASSVLSLLSGKNGMFSQGSSCNCPTFVFSMQMYRNQMIMMMMMMYAFSTLHYRPTVMAFKLRTVKLNMSKHVHLCKRQCFQFNATTT